MDPMFLSFHRSIRWPEAPKRARAALPMATGMGNGWWEDRWRGQVGGDAVNTTQDWCDWVIWQHCRVFESSIDPTTGLGAGSVRGGGGGRGGAVEGSGRRPLILDHEVSGWFQRGLFRRFRPFQFDNDKRGSCASVMATG